MLNGPFANQVVLITGAGNGLGRSMALEMARRGAVIAAIDLQEPALVSLAAQLSAGKHKNAWAVADVGNLSALQAAVASLTASLGPVDILIANAGIGFAMPAADFSVGDVLQHLQVNLLGAATSIEVVLPGMLARGRGHLVVVSSGAACRGLPLMAGYCASKAGLNALIDSLRLELQPLGICCTTLCPGGIRTALAARTFERLGHASLPQLGMLDADDAARRAVRAIAARRRCATFPLSTRVVSVILGMLPLSVGDWILRKFLRWLRKDGLPKRAASSFSLQESSAAHS
jgi:3-oxoacyl-[acyl-carrier protein] reductase